MNTEEITININYLITKETFTLVVDPSIKLYELKKKEKKLNININSKLKVNYIIRNKTTSLDNDNLTLYECNFTNNDSIIIEKRTAKGGGGNLPNEFANLSEEFIRKDTVSHFGPTIPKWRTIGKGINLYGNCEHENCKAYDKEVIMHVDSKEYNVYEESFMGICPMCNKYFDLDTCSFYKCDYRIEGKYFDKKKEDWVHLINEGSTSGGKDFFFDYKKVVEGKEGKVKYKKLILKVIKYHDYE